MRNWFFVKSTNENVKKQASIQRSLLKNEAETGAKVFGVTPKNLYREFLCLDETTWLWHEEWTVGGVIKSKTTRYDVRPSGVVKLQDGNREYRMVNKEEAERLLLAAKTYQQIVNRDLHQTRSSDLRSQPQNK